MIRALALLLALALPAQAEQLVAGLSQSDIDISADFTGSEILIYGAIKRTSPAPKTGALDVIVTLEGPSAPVTVRRKTRVAGVWINTDQVKLSSAPLFYAVSSNAALPDVLSETDDLRHGISIPTTVRTAGAATQEADAPQFYDALLRLREREGRYVIDPHGVRIAQETLFRADIPMPANIPEGTYRARIFLLRNHQIIDSVADDIRVRKVGLEGWLFGLSRNRPALYGALSLALAAACGWLASAIFRLFRW